MKTSIAVGALLALMSFAEAKAQEVYVADGVVYERYAYDTGVRDIPAAEYHAATGFAVQLAVRNDSLDAALAAIDSLLTAKTDTIAVLRSRIMDLEARMDDARRVEAENRRLRDEMDDVRQEAIDTINSAARILFEYVIEHR